ncbi:MAG: hypothetical protein LWW86_15725 [Micrococcales bacterium]|nr:hypothetical protein [Micrococcales bacterium]
MSQAAPRAREAATVEGDHQLMDAVDARDYAAGRLDYAEYAERVGARHRGSVHVPESPDPVAVYDGMWEAGTSLMGGYVWLADHADDSSEADRWLGAMAGVHRERAKVDAHDTKAQLEATAEYVARDQAIRALVLG